MQRGKKKKKYEDINFFTLNKTVSFTLHENKLKAFKQEHIIQKPCFLLTHLFKFVQNNATLHLDRN